MKKLEEELKYCYRVDKFLVHNNSEKGRENDRFEEFMLVAGDHSLIRIIDMDYAYCCVQIYRSFVNVALDPYMTNEGATVDLINNLHKTVMVYDYALTELKKMTKKEAVLSPLFELKCLIEEELENGNVDLDFSGYIDSKTMKTLEKRCEYLAHAYDLEWRGIISLDTCKRFSDIKHLDEYVKENDLFNNPEGEDKRDTQLGFTKLSWDEFDMLENFRPLGDELFRYTDKPATLKQTKLLRLAEKREVEDLSRAYKLYNKTVKFTENMTYAKSKIGKVYWKNKALKTARECDKNSSQVVFIKNF